eukprot:gene30476-37816_t
MPVGWSLQMDNDPKHTSRIVKTWLTNNEINVLELPCQ